jgi:hypothetical protein
MKGQQPTAVMRALPADVRTGKDYFARAVGAFVPKVVAAAFEKFGFHTAEIMTSWETIVGVDLASMTRPEAIKWPRGAKARLPVDEDHARGSGATLVIACDPAFALEVSYRTREVIDRINRYFGYRAIAQLRVVQAPKVEDFADRKCPPLTILRNNSTIPEPKTRGDLSAALAALKDSVAAATRRA